MYPLKLLGLASAIGLALAQDNSTSAQCSIDPQFRWMYNSLGQDPCTVASFLGGVCSTNGAFQMPSLNSGEVYVGPTKNYANDCRCSSVFFSLASACGVCQFAPAIPWSEYDQNCTSVYVSAFIKPIPKGTAVPYWAYMNVTETGGFNVSVAAALGDTPEATPTVSASSPSTSTTSTLRPSNTGGISHSSKAGPIAGGVVGGVVFIALLSVIGFYFVRQHQKKVPPAPDVTTYHIPPRESKQFIYNPSDPSTFPTSPPPLLGTTNTPGNVNLVITGSSFSTTPTAGTYYPGVAEV